MVSRSVKWDMFTAGRVKAELDHVEKYDNSVVTVAVADLQAAIDEIARLEGKLIDLENEMAELALHGSPGPTPAEEADAGRRSRRRRK